MKNKPIPRISQIMVTPEMREAYERRDKSLHDSDAPVLPPERWAKAVIGKYYRPIKPIKIPRQPLRNDEQTRS